MKKLLGIILFSCCLFSCENEKDKKNASLVLTDDSKLSKEETTNVTFTLVVSLPKSINNQEIGVFPSSGSDLDKAIYTYKPENDRLEVEVEELKEGVYQLKIGSRVGIPILVSKDEKIVELKVLNNALELEYEVIQSKQTQVFKEYISKYIQGDVDVHEKIAFLKSHSPSLATSNIYGFELVNQGFLYADKLNEIKSQFKEESYAHELVETINTMTSGSLGYGKKIPDFKLMSINGVDELGPGDFKGKYLMIDFWASWCGPCRGENPNVKKAYSKYKSKGFEVLGVSTDRTTQAWLGAVKEDGITWFQVRDSKGLVSQRYSIRSIPSVFLVNTDGVIVGKNIRGGALDVALEYFLGK